MSEEKKSWLRGARDKIEGKIEAQKEQLEEGKAQAGPLAIEKNFGTAKVSIYEGGFVRIGSSDPRSLKPDWMTPFERLRSITYREVVQDRSSREMSAKLGFGSPQRRSLSLTIATDRKVHALTTEKSMVNSADKNGMALEAAGRAVLSALATPTVAAPGPDPAPDLADQIKKLAELRDAGILTDDEFDAKKRELLDRM